MKQICSIIKNEEGSVIVVALLVLLLLIIIGISATTTSTTDIQIASNEKLYKIAFYAADAGIEAGRAALNDLKVADSGNWDKLLAGDSSLDDEIGSAGRNVGPATFTLAVRDNTDLDNNPQVDTDNIIILTSIGSYRNAQVQIEATVRYLGGGDQYAQEHYDADSSGNAARESATVASTQRWL